MTPSEAIDILAQATEPGVRLSRANYVHVDAALLVLKMLVEAQPPAPAVPPAEVT